ncbi:MAG: chemotaxis protein CheW [Albidovulum sp.]
MTANSHISGPPDKTTELLAFHTADQVFCIDIKSVRELRSWSEPTSLPHAPPYLTGVINLRGTILPVMDLAIRLGLAPLTEKERSVVIVVEVGDLSLGLAVTSVSEIHALHQDQLEPTPPHARDSALNCVSALVLVGDVLLRVLDLTAIVHDQVTSAA